MNAPSQDFFDFIAANSHADTTQLRLKGHGKNYDFDFDLAVTQITCRNKNKRKLGNFIVREKFLFPSELAAEQATHQAVAEFHRSIINENVSLLDMTAGLGIDVLSMAPKFREVTACELDTLKAEILKYNSDVCGINNLSVINTDSIKWLEENDYFFDIIYIDPARRGFDNSRVYNFHDCQPDILKNLKLLTGRSNRLFIKASPLLDISQTLKDFNSLLLSTSFDIPDKANEYKLKHNQLSPKGVVAIRVICVGGECKEILTEVAIANNDDKITFEAIDLAQNGKIISGFLYHDSILNVKQIANKAINPLFATLEDIVSGCYLYEPNAAVMKLAPWDKLIEKYPSIKKFDVSSHLFVSPVLYDDFPGRILEIERIIDKKERKTLKGLPLNVAVRNYPLSAEQLRKELNVKEGTDRFIYGSRIKVPLLILAHRIK